MSTKIRRSLSAKGALALAGLVAASFALTSCGADANGANDQNQPAGEPVALSESEWNDVVAAAEQEGEVVVYSSLSDVETTFKKFEKAYPKINVTVERAPTSDLITRLDQELDMNVTGADVTMHSLAAWFDTRSTDGSFADVKVSPENEKSGWIQRLDGRNYSQTLATPTLLGWNKNSGSKVTTAQEVLDKGRDAKIGIINPEITAAQAYQYDLWNEAYGADFMQKLSKLNIKTYSSNVPLAQDLAAGALDYAVAVTPSTLSAVKAEGAPVDLTIPTENVSGVMYNAAVLANAGHSNAAQVFANWLASEDGQKAIVGQHSPVAVPLKVDGSLEWDSISHADTSVWTNEHWKEWVKNNWTPYFS
jgi:iron(III) transport system substrate-binding protein